MATPQRDKFFVLAYFPVHRHLSPVRAGSPYARQPCTALPARRRPRQQCTRCRSTGARPATP